MNKDTLNSNDSEHTSNATDIHTDELNIQMTRRRLLKGAALGAPVILTLRSGALMAAGSCTGVKTSNGTPISSPTAPDDYCVLANPGANDCPSTHILNIEQNLGKAITNTNIDGSFYYTCSPSTTGGTPVILSLSAYQSFYPNII